MRRIVILIPFVWLLVFFLAPLAMVLRVSLSEPALAIPPYLPVFESLFDIPEKIGQLTVANYLWLARDNLYWLSFVSSLKLAAAATLLTLLIGYPLAYAMTKPAPRIRRILLIGLIVPFWTSFLIRVYAWIGILKPEGLLNHILISAGVISEPLVILNTDAAVLIGIVYTYLPFMVLPLYAVLANADRDLLEAAADLGATPASAFWHITVPLSLPGVIAGCLLVFIPAVGEFVIPDLLGGSDTLMTGTTMWNEFFRNRDWPVASALALVLLAILTAPILLFNKNREEPGVRIS